jgi:SWI/SNF-related matrix-associated actin-dependent regulator of chromatin subfamily A3
VTPQEEAEEEEEEEEEELSFLGTVKFQVVGIRYYKGEAHPGEYVTLTREPHNMYDRNAVRVDNLRGEKVGHVKREQAAAIAPILDGPLAIKVDATIPHPGNQWNLPLQLEFYGKDTSLSVEVERILMRHCIGLHRSPVALPKSTSTTAAAAKPAAAVVIQKKTVDWKAQQKDLDSMFEQQCKTQLANLPAVDIDPTLLQVDLFDHQIQGIRWLVHMESGTVPAPFYKEVMEQGKKMWLSEITNSSQSTAPKPIRGGILADDMGLGKTIQAIGLILANPPEGRDYNVPAIPARKQPSRTSLNKLSVSVLQRVLKDAKIVCTSHQKTIMVNALLEAFSSGALTTKKYYNSVEAPKTTLIVCPVSVMSNWVSQIETHVRPGALRVAMYHGPHRQDLDLDEIDVLIASYNTIAYDFGQEERHADEPASKRKKTSSIVFDTKFHRVLLDEAHMIRSTKTRTYRACTALEADRRFCLTGTPLQNRPDDIHSLFSFLDVEPLGNKEVFRRAISQPIQVGDEMGLARLRAMMSHVALRRNKTTVNIEMPEKEVQLRSIEFPDGHHKTIHHTLFQTAQVAFQATLQGGDAEALKNYMSVLETLLRIRQACCSGVLIPKERLERAENVLKELENRGAYPLTAEEGKALLAKLKGTFEEQEVECAVCLCEMEENVAIILRACSHVFCQTCINRVAVSGHGACPLCRQEFGSNDMIAKSAACKAVESPTQVEAPISQSMEDLEASPKVNALLQAIGEMKPGEKGVVFSQFTKFLDEIEKHLAVNGYTLARIDGKKTAPQRLQAMKAFAGEMEGPQFMLCSLHA